MLIDANCDKCFHLIAVKVDHRNTDLSPWKAPAVFGKEDFGEGAGETLTKIKKLCACGNKNYYIGGYSLAGLFALRAAYRRRELFKGVAAASTRKNCRRISMLAVPWNSLQETSPRVCTNS